MKRSIADFIKDCVKKISFTREDFDREKENFSPEFYMTGSVLNISNKVLVGDKEYNIITSLELKKWNRPNFLLHVRFTTYEINEETKDLKKSDVYDKVMLKKVKTQIEYNFAHEPFNALVQKARSFFELDSILRSLVKSKQFTPEQIKTIDNIMQQTTAPTLNVRGLSTKVFPSIMLSIKEGFKRLNPNAKIAGISMAAKGDYANDTRRSEIYHMLFKKFSDVITGSPLKYTIEGGFPNFRYVFDQPITLADIEL
jgi:hypothetical protein